MAAVVLVASPSALARSTVEVSLDRGLRCPSAAALRGALISGLAPHVPLFTAKPVRWPRAAVRGTSQGALQVRLEKVRGGPPITRTLRAERGECAELAQTAALLLRTWLEQVPATAPELAGPPNTPPVPEQPVRPETAPSPSPAAPVTSPEEPAPVPGEAPIPTEVTRAPEPPAAPAEPDAGPSAPSAEAPATTPPAAIAPPVATPPVIKVAPAPPPPAAAEPEPPVQWSPTIAVQGLGGASWMVGRTDTTARGGLRAELAFAERFAAGLQLGAETSRSQAVAPGRVVVAAQSAVLLLGWSLHGPEEGGAELCAGLQLERLAARSEGYSETGAEALFAPALWAEAGWRQPLVGGLFASLRVGATLRASEEVFTVQNVGPVLTLPPFGLQVLAGAGWRFPAPF